MRVTTKLWSSGPRWRREWSWGELTSNASQPCRMSTVVKIKQIGEVFYLKRTSCACTGRSSTVNPVITAVFKTRRAKSESRQLTSVSFDLRMALFLFPIIRTSYQLFSKATVSWGIPSTQLHITSPDSFPLTWDMRLPKKKDLLLYSKHSKTHVWNCYSNIWTPTPCRARTGVTERLLTCDSLSGATARFTKCLLAYYRHFRTSIRLLCPFLIFTKLLLSLQSSNGGCQNVC